MRKFSGKQSVSFTQGRLRQALVGVAQEHNGLLLQGASGQQTLPESDRLVGDEAMAKKQQWNQVQGCDGWQPELPPVAGSKKESGECQPAEPPEPYLGVLKRDFVGKILNLKFSQSDRCFKVGMGFCIAQNKGMDLRLKRRIDD